MSDVDLAATEWMEGAACKGRGDLFVGDPKPRLAERTKAAAICAKCPVLAACGHYAVDQR